jgi:putative ABC transport system permease protein
MPRPIFGTRFHRRLMWLYPREFREEYGEEMAYVYRNRAANEGAVRLWLALLADIVRTAPREHLSVLSHDVRHAFRLFWRTPIVTATALLTIALGVGSTTAIFSVVYGILLRPLPYPDANRLVELFEDNRPANMPRFRVSALNYLSWTERATGFEALGVFSSLSATLTDRGDPESVPGGAATASMFEVLGLAPIAGRAFQPSDERVGAARVALLGESLWRRRFGGDPAIVGQLITINGERYEVIGVVPPAFRDIGRSIVSSTAPPQVFVPFTIDLARENRGNHTIRVVGRLRAGVSIGQAQDEMQRLAAALEQEFPATNKGWGVQIDRISNTMFDPRVRPSLLTLLAAVALVLLIACANVASVLLARNLSRQRELALRSALGARRSRLIRQLMTEGACFAVVSGAAGLLLATLAVRVLKVMLPPTLPRIDEIVVDPPVLAAGLLASIASGLVVGLIPAWRASRAVLTAELAQQGRGIAGTSGMLARHTLVVAQMALATMLLVGAALLLQSFARLQQVRLGFEPDRVITARIGLPRTSYPDAARTLGFWQRLLESLDGRAAVQSAAIGTSAPFTPGVRAGGRVRDRRTAAASADGSVGAIEHVVSANYFRTLGIPVLAGRTFGVEDSLESPRVTIVSESVASALWPGANPIGQTIQWNGSRAAAVIGVVGDVRGAAGQGARGGGLDLDPGSAAYFAVTQQPLSAMTLVVRTSDDSTASASLLRQAAQAIDPAQPVTQVRRLGDWLDETAAEPRFTSFLSSAFAGVALILAAVGIYGVLAGAVAQRTKEIGVRMAVGAARGQIVRMILRWGFTVAGSGIAIGLVAAVALSPVLEALLFGVTSRDPVTYVVVGATLATVALLACYVPAARATKIDPLIALRCD